MRFLGLAALAALPLQWFILGASLLGDFRLHQLALFSFTGFIILYYGLTRALREVTLLHVFIVANIYMLVIWSGVNVYNGISPVQPAQQVLYLTVFIAVATYFVMACNAPDSRVIEALRWSALFTGIVVITAFGLSMMVNGISPISVLQRTIAAGDPSILQAELFRGSFSGFGIPEEEASGKLRREVFGALLLSMYVASWANARCPLTEPGQRMLYRTAMVVNSLMLLVSISRSVLLAAALWPTILLLRALLTGRTSLAQQAAAAVAVLGVLAAAALGFLEVLWVKFTTDTSSYEVREAFVSLAFTRIADNFWLGGVDTASTSSHNFVLDAWQRGGIFVAIPAIIVFSFVFLLWFSLLIRLPVIDPVLVPVVAAFALPCTRLVTQGGGLITLVSWTCLGFAMGVLAAHARADRAVAPPPAAYRGGQDRPAPRASLWTVDPMRPRQRVGAERGAQ